MAYFWITRSKGSGTSTDLTPIENAVTAKGGTVEKEDEKATVAEIVASIATIPIEGYGEPLKGVVVDNVSFPSDFNVTDSFNIELEDAEE